jgi:hypothetical protein
MTEQDGADLRHCNTGAVFKKFTADEGRADFLNTA